MGGELAQATASVEGVAAQGAVEAEFLVGEYFGAIDASGIHFENAIIKQYKGEPVLPPA